MYNSGGGGLVTKSCPTLAIPWTVACQAPLPMGFSRQEYWKWVAISFSRRSSQLRDRIQVSCIAGRFFTNWAMREAPWEALYLEMFGVRAFIFFSPIVENVSQITTGSLMELTTDFGKSSKKRSLSVLLKMIFIDDGPTSVLGCTLLTF